MKQILCLLAPLILAVPAFCYSMPSDASTERIVYLNLTWVDGEVRLNSVNVVNGHLKQRKAIRLAPNQLYYVVTSQSGRILHEGTIPDPSMLRVEYADDEGRLHMQTAVRQITDFSIRVPYHEELHRVTIRRIGDEVPEIQRISDAAEVGSFEINLNEEDRP